MCTTFPTDAATFRLRFDFAIELGMLDEIRAPMSPEAFEALRAAEPTLAKVDLAVHNRERAHFALAGLPQFMLIFGAIPPGQVKVTKWISDGTFPYSTNDATLWNDFLRRIAYAKGDPIQKHPCIYPPPLTAPVNRWILPGEVVVHDTANAIAAILPWKVGYRYFQFNRQAS